MHTRGKNERGVSAVEYGLLIACCAVAFLFSIQMLGTMLSASYSAAAPRCGTPAAANAEVCTGDPIP